MSFKLDELVAGESVLVDQHGRRRLFLGMSKYGSDCFITENLGCGTLSRWNKADTMDNSKLEQPAKKLYAIKNQQGRVDVYATENEAITAAGRLGYKRTPEYDIEITSNTK